MGSYDDRPYDVGKGKPPRQHRWQKGVSGNPSGPKRRKKAVDATLPELVQDVLEETVVVTRNGRETRVTKLELMAAQLVNDSLQGAQAQRVSSIKMLVAIGAFSASVENEKARHDLSHDAVASVMKQLAAEYDAEQDVSKDYPS